ncbi:hypothetical protein SDC9_99205 [bioreactor metagenome]|uniref:Uncharacterized protein n=1 Tax=bioreactor metagenome TaxID=1076179 RepID=A0A645AHN0_9ZZZZ
MSGGGQAGTVHKGGVRHPQLRGSFVHFIHKTRFAAVDMFRQSHCGIVGRDHRHALEHLVDGHLFAFLEPDLRSSHGRGGCRYGHLVGKGNTAFSQGFHHQQQSHYLGDAGGFHFCVGIFLKKHLSRLLLHEQGGARLHSRGARHGGGGKNQAGHGQNGRNDSFHGARSSIFYTDIKDMEI